AMCPELELKTADVSSKLGRGRHTTRHVEMFTMPNGAMIADTPGFSAFDTEQAGVILKDELADTFIEFEPYIGSCRYTNCSHTSERGCAVLKALSEGKIQPSRHNRYVRMYEQAKQMNRWD
ncbi:MAG: ribosome small subunit-dependent GTPase A, partial [Oscillospiraceae bacterium]|nr:ribosome small subunit-dependent GTPase A [Oscillospiraceae bacterium]